MTDMFDLLIERPDRLRLCRFADLVSRAPAPWQIKGVLREQSVTQLYSPRGCYKSFVALDLAASVATGIAWQGRPIIQPGLVIYVAAEGGGGMVQRARAWSEQHGIPAQDINLLFVTEPVQVTATSEDIAVLIHRIQDLIGYTPTGHIDHITGHTYDQPLAREWPVMIVIDTLARCFVGDESGAEDMGQFVQGVDRLKIEFNASILIVHHTGWDEKRERGSTTFGGACDTIYKLEADKKAATLSLINTKMKDGAEPAPIPLSYREVSVSRYPNDDPDEDLSSVIIESVVHKPLTPKQAIVFQVVQRHPGVRRVDICSILAGKISLRTIDGAILELLKTGEIIEEKHAFFLKGAGVQL